MTNFIKIITIVFLIFSFQAFGQDKKMINTKEAKVAIENIQEFDAIPEEMLSDKVKSAINITSTEALPQEGVVYDIISSRNTSFNDCFKCGPAVGYETSCISKYTIETRKYTEYKNGAIARVWMSTVSVFMGCGTW